MFSFGQIATCALVAGAASVVVLRFYRSAALSTAAAVALGLVVALSILIWRSAGNTPALNDDPIAFVSPNDVLCPVVTYVGLGLYAAVRRTAPGKDWPRVRLLLTLVSLVMNIVTI
jgi:hypothetical protein